jgi:hypothetical protein
VGAFKPVQPPLYGDQIILTLAFFLSRVPPETRPDGDSIPLVSICYCRHWGLVGERDQN